MNATLDQPGFVFEYESVEHAHTHVLMPNMAFACGRSITDYQQGGAHFTVGVGGQWHRVDCPDCRAIGPDTIRAETRRQQGLPPLTDTPKAP